LSQLRQYEKELVKFRVKVAVVTFEAGFLARSYVQDMGLKWPLLIDEKREVYKAYNMFTASFWDIWGPRTWWAYLKEFSKGRLPKKSAGDISQRGGDVLIDPNGVVRLHHIGQGPADRPSVEAILKTIQPEADFQHGLFDQAIANRPVSLL
jgi:peroxiredoxin